MPTTYCSSCGTELKPHHLFCPKCGASVGPPQGALPYAPPTPRSDDRLLMMIILVVVILVVGSIVASAAMYALVSGLITAPPQAPMVLGVAISRSADGSNWTLTFTSVPAGITPGSLDLALLDASGMTVLAGTPVSALTGEMALLTTAQGSLYLEYLGANPQTVSPGDAVLIGTMTTGGLSTTGFQVRLAYQAAVLFVGTLQ